MDDEITRENGDDDQHDLTGLQADLFVVGWSSFLAAAIGTMLLFAWVDPLTLTESADIALPLGRMGGYALGFFFLWMLCLLSAALCAYLIRTRHERAAADSRKP